MFNITKDHIPNRDQIMYILSKTRENQAVPPLGCSKKDYDLTVSKVESIRKQIIELGTHFEMLSGNTEEKNEICLERYDKRFPLHNSDLIREHKSSVTLIPVGLLVRALCSNTAMETQVDKWLEKAQAIHAWKFPKIEGASPNSNAEASPSIEETMLRAEVDLLKQELQEAKEARHEKQEIMDRSAARLTEARKERDQARGVLERLTRLPPKYKIRKEDPASIRGAFQDEDSLFAKRYNGISKMSTLISKGLEYTVIDLFDSADEFAYEEITDDVPNVKPYHVNHSVEIAFGDEFEGHRTAIVAFLVLRLLEGASLRNPQEEGDCHGDPKVGFNDQDDLYIQASHPIRAPLDPLQEPIILFQNPTSWAPKPDYNNYPEGIDPVAAKILLYRLSEEERIYLKRLILDPFMLLGDNLREAYQYRDKNAEGSRQLQVAYDLIHTMARALIQNYKVHIGRKLLELFDDDDKKAFRRPENVAVPTAMAEPEVAWSPKWAWIPEDLRGDVSKRQQQLALIWESMSGDILDASQSPTLKELDTLGRRHFKEQLGRQYYLKHNFSHSSCRVESLATLLFQKTPDNFNPGWAIMKIIAAYLDEPENRAKFEEDIHRLNLTVEQVQHSYRNQGTSLIENDLEIEMAAHALGITIGLFVPGAPVGCHPSGLVEPVLFFGPKPRTKERLYILTDGNSFYALEPKRDPSKANSLELQDAINTHLPFWRDGRDDELRIMEQLGLR